MFVPWHLRWRDVDPARHPFDPAAIRDDDLVRQFGLWASGYAWTPTDGGPVQIANLDLFGRPGDRETKVRGLILWRDHIETLARLFAEIGYDDTDPARSIEIAAARLLPVVLERTGGDDAWYTTMSTVLAWYAEWAGFGDDDSRTTIFKIIGGAFHSWVEPDPAVATRTFAAIGAAIVNPPAIAEPVGDALATWERVRVKLFDGLRPVTSSPVDEDGHARYIDTIEQARDPERAERMRAALVLCRDSAARGMPLSIDQLAEWQGVVLGLSAPAPIRTTDAFAKGGRERYGTRDDLGDMLDRALRHPDNSIVAKAARAYLDVCFYHPFVDGNGRAARLALDHVLTAGGFAVQHVAPLFLLPRWASDTSVTWGFASALMLLAGPRR